MGTNGCLLKRFTTSFVIKHLMEVCPFSRGDPLICLHTSDGSCADTTTLYIDIESCKTELPKCNTAIEVENTYSNEMAELLGNTQDII